MMRSAPALRDRARKSLRQLAPMALCLAASGATLAQDSGRRWTVQPSVSINETITDNSLLRDSDKRSDAITLLTAGITVAGRGDRVRGSLDYQLSGSVHARETRSNRTAQFLRSALQSELVDDFFFIDASASITQQAISALGLQDVTPGFDNPNRTEVRSLSVTPQLRGRIGTFAVYDARVNFSRQDSDAGSQGDQSGRTQSLTVSAPASWRLGWNAALIRAITDYKGGRSTSNDRALVGLTYQYDASLRLSVNVGREENDITTLNDQNNNTWGVTVAWAPSERTQFTASREHRFFGDAHHISLLHRQARTTWRFGSSRDIQSSQPTGNQALVTAYDAFFDLFAAQQPDPVLRQQLVLQFLQQRGIPANALFPSGNPLTSAVTLANRQDLSFGYQGLRSSVAVNYFRSSTRRLDQAVNVGDDLANEAALRQQALTLTLGHRLTPISGISLTLSHQRNRGETSQLSTTTNSVLLNWNTDLGRRSTFSLGARRVEFDSTTSPYTENAVYATLGVRF